MVSILPSGPNFQNQEDEYEMRNRELYNMLSKDKVVIVPDERILTIDKLPKFTILEQNIRNRHNQKVYKETEKARKKFFNLNYSQKYCAFHQQINEDSMKHYQYPSPFYSKSLMQKNRAANLSAWGMEMGWYCKEELDKIDRRAKEMHQKQIEEEEKRKREKQETEEINKLLGQLDFENLPPIQRLIVALKLKVTMQQVCPTFKPKQKVQNASLTQQKSFNGIFNTHISRRNSNISSAALRVENKSHLQSFTPDQSQHQLNLPDPTDQCSNKMNLSQLNLRVEDLKNQLSAPKSKKSQRVLPRDKRFFHKFKDILRKGVRSMVNQKVLEQAAQVEKRKLEIDILRQNEKNKVTQVILDQIDLKDAQRVVPNYKFKDFKKRIKGLNKHMEELKIERKNVQVRNLHSQTQQHSPIQRKPIIKQEVKRRQVRRSQSEWSQFCSESEFQSEYLDNVFFQKYEDRNARRGSKFFFKQLTGSSNFGMSQSIRNLLTVKFDKEKNDKQEI